MAVRIVTVATLAFVLLAGNVMAQDGTIKIGGLYGTTGPQANFGIPYQDGMILAAKEINENGGIKVSDKTYTIELSIADTRTDAPKAVAEAWRMMADDVKIFYCCNLSLEAVPVSNVVLLAGALIVSPNSAMTKFIGTEGRDQLLHSANPETGPRGTAAMFVSFLADRYEAKTAAVVLPSDDAGKFYADVYFAALETKGIKVIAVEQYDHGTTDFAPLLTLIKAKKPDNPLAGHSDEIKGILRQARELGIDAQYVGSVGASNTAGDGLASFAYPAFTRYTGPEQTDPRVRAYLDALGSVGEVTSYSFWSIITYDWMYVLANAFSKVSDVNDLAGVAKNMTGLEYDGVVSWKVDDIGIGRPAMEGVFLKDATVAELLTIEVPSE